MIKDDYHTFIKQDIETLNHKLSKEVKTLPLLKIIPLLYIIKTLSENKPLTLKFKTVSSVRRVDNTEDYFKQQDSKWLREEILKLSDEANEITVSEWAERTRYLPPQITSMPGFYDYNVAPFLREIADCMSLVSPIREIDLMKAAQIGATVGILENTIGYTIDHVKTAPVMLLTADAELAKLRLESYITPMLQHSSLMHLIRSADETNTRKTGKDKQETRVGRRWFPCSIWCQKCG